MLWIANLPPPIAELEPKATPSVAPVPWSAWVSEAHRCLLCRLVAGGFRFGIRPMANTVEISPGQQLVFHLVVYVIHDSERRWAYPVTAAGDGWEGGN